MNMEVVLPAIATALKVYGIVIVISFLCAFIIWAIVHVLSAMAEKQPAGKAAEAEAAVPPPLAVVPAMPAANDDIPPEHVVAIAAAVHYLSEEATILRIEDTRGRAAWVAEGRAVLHSSHNPIRNR